MPVTSHSPPSGQRHSDRKPLLKLTLESCIATRRVSNGRRTPLHNGTPTFTCELYPSSKALAHATSLAHPWIAHCQSPSHCYQTVALVTSPLERLILLWSGCLNFNVCSQMKVIIVLPLKGMLRLITGST